MHAWVLHVYIHVGFSIELQYTINVCHLSGVVLFLGILIELGNALV